MQSKKEINQAVADLVSNIEAGAYKTTEDVALQSYPNIRVDDIYPAMRPFFTEKAAKALHNKASSLIHQRNEHTGHEGLVRFLATLGLDVAKQELHKHGYVRVIDMVNFVGVRCNKQNMALAMSKTISTINDLAEKDYITAALLPLSIVELHHSAGPDMFCIVSYIAINKNGQTYVDNNLKDMTFQEGAVPNNIKDIK